MRLGKPEPCSPSILRRARTIPTNCPIGWWRSSDPAFQPSRACAKAKSPARAYERFGPSFGIAIVPMAIASNGHGLNPCDLDHSRSVFVAARSPGRLQVVRRSDSLASDHALGSISVEARVGV